MSDLPQLANAQTKGGRLSAQGHKVGASIPGQSHNNSGQDVGQSGSLYPYTVPGVALRVPPPGVSQEAWEAFLSALPQGKGLQNALSRGLDDPMFRQMWDSAKKHLTPDGIERARSKPPRHMRNISSTQAAPRPVVYLGQNPNRPDPDYATFLRNLPTYDYVYPDGGPINFTAVEIIVFLPRLFLNRAITERFINNGMQNPIHLEIFKAHRHIDLAHERNFLRNFLCTSYRLSMRQNPGALSGEERRNAAWTRNTHQVPLNWNPLDISMNGFIPNKCYEGNYWQPPSVPFRDLAKDVKKMPAGFDVADLTRALEWVLRQPEYDEYGQHVQYMFPDHLQPILDFIGRTPITQAHTDGFTISRWSEVRKKTNGEAQAKVFEKHPMERDEGGRFLKKNAPPTDPAALNRHTYLDPLTSYKVLDREFPVATGAQATWLTPLTPPTGVRSQYSRIRDLEDANPPDGFFYHTPPVTFPSYHSRHLLRDCVEVLYVNDMSELAQAARIALQPDQIHIDWRIEDIPALMSVIRHRAFVDI